MINYDINRVIINVSLLCAIVSISACNEPEEKERKEVRVDDSVYYIEGDKLVNTQILEIAIDTDDQVVINTFLRKARLGDEEAKDAMRNANPERFISLAKRGKYDIDIEALKFLKVMDEFGNSYAHEAIKSLDGDKTSEEALRAEMKSASTQSNNTVHFTYSGVSPLEARTKADAEARKWKSRATLQAVVAEKWILYGDQNSGKVRGIEVPKWRFIYVAEGKIGEFLVTEKNAQLLKEENVPLSQPPNSPLIALPLESWLVDASDALSTAYMVGINILQGPWLWMRRVDGQWEPVWTVLSETKGHFVSAKTGEMLAQKNVE